MFQQSQRLARQKDIMNVLRRGRGCASPLFSLKVLLNNLGHHRVTVVVSNKTERSAVKRNRMKRRVRAALKEVLPRNSGQGWDVMVVLRSPVLSADYSAICSDLRRCVQKKWML